MVLAFYVEVTDHAVVRWLERAKGIDVAALRREIADLCEPAMLLGAVSVRVSGVKFQLAGNRVCTVVRTKSPENRHAPVLEPRQSRASEKRRWQRMVP